MNRGANPGVVAQYERRKEEVYRDPFDFETLH